MTEDQQTGEQQPEKIETEGPEIVDVEHPAPRILGSEDDKAEQEAANAKADQEADEDEDRQAGAAAKAATSLDDAKPMEGSTD